ncbi:MAG: sigma-54-dependent Fis family transcriptional regulator [Deltaproteobacteria bacterium]|nr:sigma-54-dependent Fis family transcriptional regulator [Deltaproteobacteria bacterium]
MTTAPLRRVLVVDDEENIRHMLALALRPEGFEVTAAASGPEALAALATAPFDVVLSDVRMPGMGGLELLAEIQARHPGTVVIIMSAYGTVDTAIEAMKRGAYDYISKPFKPVEVVLLLRKAEERERLKRENLALKQDLERMRGGASAGFGGMVARSAVMQELFRTVRKIAEYKTTVLVLGESGTGKELVAQAIHAQSPRASGPFVPLNCGAIPEALLESELFGHVRGAFTDATRDKKGLFAEADGGTIFLDEIGELPLNLQVKLLRVLQEEEFRRLGETRGTRVDVRVVAATVKDLQTEARTGRFREDLFYRLNVLPVTLPPLRERLEDVPLLVEHFIRRTNARLGTRIEGIAPEAMKVLLGYSWPGNVRELENTIEHAVVLAEHAVLGPETLPPKIRESGDQVKASLLSGTLSIKKTVRLIEEELIRRALKQTGGNRTTASKVLEISHRALLYKIKAYGITD